MTFAHTEDDVMAPADLRPVPTYPPDAPAPRATDVRLRGRSTGRRAKSIVVAVDVVAAVAALGLVELLPGEETADRTVLALVALVATPLSVGAVGALRVRNLGQVRDELRKMLEACLLVVGCVATSAVVLDIDLPGAELAAFGAFLVLTLMAGRLLLRRAFGRARRRGQLVREVSLVGSAASVTDLGAVLEGSPDLGYRVSGHVVVDGTDDADSIVGQVDAVGAPGVILVPGVLDAATTRSLVRRLGERGVHLEVSSGLFGVESARLVLRPMGALPVVYVEPVKHEGWRAAAKRTMDLALGSIALVITTPLVLMCGIAVKLTSRGPMFFVQERVGRSGRTFRLLKLRTMVDGAEGRLGEVAHLDASAGPVFKIPNDPRVTRVGRILRRTSLDELPQLINVMAGDMSLVGPRPALPAEVEAWDCDPDEVLCVRPGITGLWQVNGRSDADDRYLDYNQYYVDNWSLKADLGILLRTVVAVTSGRGAY